MSEHGAGPEVRSRPPRPRAWVVALAAGVIATALTSAAGEASVDRFRPKEVIHALSESPDLAGAYRVMVQNATLTYGLQGALLGLTLGLAGAVVARSSRTAVVAALAGVVLGGVLGAAASFGLFTAFLALTDANWHDLIPALLAHAGVASALGSSAGSAYGLGRGGRGVILHATLGGMVGAVVGAAVYQLVGAIVFPIAKTDGPVATTLAARLLSHALIDMLASLGAVAVVPSIATGPDPVSPSE